MKATGVEVKKRLLVLDDGDSLVVNGERWMAFGGHGFEVEDLFDPTYPVVDVKGVDRSKIEAEFLDEEEYEVMG